MSMKIKNLLLMVIVTFSISLNVLSQESSTTFGAKVMVGGRYDDVRMCVASDAGVKGGPIADIMFLTRFEKKSNFAYVLEIPVMRPILFAAAFNMLQFEPQITAEFSKALNNNKNLVLGPGIGVSLHYGPDYKSDFDNKGDSFFAVGPMVSLLFGVNYNKPENNRKVIGIRPFYIPLFSTDSRYPSGNVIGGVLEAHFYF